MREIDYPHDISHIVQEIGDIHIDLCLEFPRGVSAKDLFHSCKQYGHVVDTFIPFKRSKDGKRFEFVRFINVFNVERLVSNLCTIWVDRSKFHENIARFHRAPLNNNKVPTEQKFGYNRNINNVRAKEGVTTGSSKSYVHAVKVKNMFEALECDSMPSIVLDNECLISKDLSKALLGRVKEFASLPNLKIVLKNEGFAEIKIQIVWVEIEGVPFKLWSKNAFKRIAAKWGELMDVDDQEEEGKVFLIHAKEVPGWVSEFVDDSDDDDESDNGFKDGDDKVQDGGSHGDDSDENKDKSENMKPSDHSLKYPPDFTPNGDNNEFCMHEENVRSVNEANSLNCNVEENQNGQERNSTNKGGFQGRDFGFGMFCFNVQGANVFNAFIANAGLEEVPLGGSSFTWCYKSATKMSKLDRSQLNIRGIMVDGKWTEKPNNVKLEFLHHFRNRFNKPTDNRVHFDMNFPKSITIDQQMDLECVVSKEELKRAVWECGTDKSPGPDGFSFDIPNGCNSSFIALIPKVPDANLVKDFRPISLIGRINLSPLVNLSHMFYADDAVFVGQWYDGTKVGGNMSRVQAWTEVVDKVKSRLSNWKMKSLSIRVDTRTLWIKCVPIKVNVLAWKIKIEALPTRFNISHRGIDIDSILCPIKYWKKVRYPPWHPKSKISHANKQAKSGHVQGMNQFVSRTATHVKSISSTPQQFEQLLKSVQQIGNFTAAEEEINHQFTAGTMWTILVKSGYTSSDILCR
uniref:Nucleotide-binding alpha-beta plait domain-containing protein n=1 Tax=Tanacetum cinerariifolium TaxID=118510 RepID=A0A6L2J269_TANCI|nr:nucleotide-binding alpha-beta plait domain-containing protein [Tanacetum cinerariifolium]